MASTHSITFDIRGNLDPSLLAALQNAQKHIQNLSNATRNVNAKALANAQKLAASQAQLNAIKEYRNLQNAIRQTQATRANELVSANRLLSLRGQEVQKLSEMRQAYDTLRTVYRQNKKSMGEEAANVMRRQMQSARAEIKIQSDAVKNIDKEFSSASKSVAKLAEQLTAQQAKLREAQSQLSAQGLTGTLAAHEMQLRASIQATTNALNQEIAALERRNQIHTNFQNAQQNLSNAYGNFQNSVQTAQTMLSPFTGAIDKAVEFEHTMSTLRSISQMDLIKNGQLEQAESNMARLTAQAKELGATTIYTAQQIGEAQVYVARTGWDTDAVEKSMPSILKLAASNRMGIEETADIVTNVMTAFGHGVDQIEKDADIFAYTVTHSNQTLSQFGEAMKYAAPIAKAFGASMEETAMMTKFTGDAGIQGSMAGTSMRQTMLRLVAPPKKASKAMDELGVSTSDATKQWNEAREVAASYGVTLDENLTPGRQFINIMKQLDAGFKGKDSTEILAALSAITGINAVSGAANIFGAGADKAENFTQLLEQCEGMLNQTYATMTDDTFGAAKSFESAWEAVQLSIGESLLGISRAGYEFAAPLLTSLSQFIDANPAVVQAAAGIAAAVSAATVSVAGFSLAMAGVRFAQAGWATAGLMFSDFATKITAARTALATLNIGAWWASINAAFMATISAPFTALATKITAITTALRGLTLANISAGISGGISAAGAAFSSLGSAITIAARAAFAFAFSPVGAALMAIGAAAYYAYNNWDKVSAAFSSVANALGGVLMPALSSAGTALSNLFSALNLDGLSEVIGSVANAIGGGLVGAIVAAVGTIGSLITGIVVGFAGLITTIADLGSGIAQAFSNFKAGNFAEAFAGLKNTGEQAARNFKNAWLDSFDAIKAGMKGTNSALEILMSTSPAAISSPPPDTATQTTLTSVDTAVQNFSTNLSNVDTATQNFSTNLSNVDTATQNFSANLSNVDTATQSFSTNLSNVDTATQSFSANLSNVDTATQSFSANLSNVDTATQNFSANLSNVDTAVQNFSTNLSNVDTAVQNFSTNLSSIDTATQSFSANLSNVDTATQSFSTNLSNVDTATQSFSANLSNVDTATQNFSANLSNVDTATQNFSTNLSSVDTATQSFSANLSSVDTAVQSFSANLSNVDTATQSFSANLSSVDTATQNFSTNLSSIDMAAQNTAQNIDSLAISAQNATPNLDSVGISAQNATPNLDSLGNAASSSVGNIDAMSNSAGAVAGALAAKAAEIGAIHIPQPQLQIVHTTVSVAAAASTSNFRGGIYPKGEFLTTFAEKSPEAAIPIDNSQRARSLWVQTGQLLGIIDKKEENFPRRYPKSTPRRVPTITTPPTFPTLTPPTFPTLTPPTFPTLTPPTFPTLTPPTFPTPESNDLPPIQVTINVTIHGNANEQSVQRGVESALPSLRRSFAQELATYRHEQARRSFA